MRQGITVIELMIVLAIIAIMGILMAPAIGEWAENYRIRQGARDIVSTLQLARMRAISTCREYKVVFDVTNETCQLQQGNLPTNSTSWEDEGGAVSMSRGVNINSTNFPSDTVQFNPNGSSSNGRIEIANVRGKQYRIMLTRVGRPAIIEGW